MAAQSSVGLTLTALLWWRPLRPILATLLLLLAIWLAVLLPVEPEFLQGLGATLSDNHIEKVLRIAAALATISMLLARRWVPLGVAALGEYGLYKLTGYLMESDWELAGAHLAFFGLLIGLCCRERRTQFTAPTRPAPELHARACLIDDLGVFAVAVLLAGLVSTVVLGRYTSSGDEWADTFQAAVFAKGHAYASMPPCSEAFRSFWVFQYMGRSFSQYTPGWPLFMAPFVAVGAAWLAGPFSLGVLAAGVARLARRAAAGFAPSDRAPDLHELRAAGWLAGLCSILPSTMLINGGSRFPHVFVAAMYAWALEALLRIATPEPDHRRQWLWGTVLGGTAALMVSARPGDGGMLGVGLFVYALYALIRGRLGLRAIVGGVLACAVMGGWSLWVLRLQLGKWFATGYSLNPLFYAWNKFKWSIPRPDEYRWGFPLATGSYCWWPSAPALGFAGIATLRGRARRMAVAFVFSYVPFTAFYALLEVARRSDHGYGPRYLLPAIVPMAMGTGLMLAKLWTTARSRWFANGAIRRGGPAALALASGVWGLVRIAPLVYPYNYADVMSHNRLHEALSHMDLHNAIVLASGPLTNTDPMDLTENLPLELYPKQDVLIAIDRSPELARCVRDRFPDRRLYRARATPNVEIVPYN